MLRSFARPRRSLYSLRDFISDHSGEHFRGSVDVALPEAQHSPASELELGGLSFVSLDIPFDLRDPVGCVVATCELGESPGQISPVPEVAVDEHRHLRAAKNDVWSAWDVTSVDSITET